MRKFISPNPLLDCVTQLQRLIIGNNILSSNRVEVLRSDDEQYDFEVRRWEFLNHIATMHGSFIYEGEQRTRIIYRVDYSTRFLIVLVLYFAFIIFAVFSTLINHHYQSVPVMGIFALLGFTCYRLDGLFDEEVCKFCETCIELNNLSYG